MKIMERIYFRQYYTPVVEQYLRAVVRKWKPNSIPSSWYKFTVSWLDFLSKEDKEFIQFVFHPDYYNSYVGVSCYPYEQFLLNFRRLYNLERRYAIDAGLLDETVDCEGDEQK